MAETQVKTSSNNCARRSLSIFSRKGYDAASPVSAQSLAVASIALATPSAPSAASQQNQSPTKSSSKKWKMKKCNTSQQQGTILRLVPKEIAAPPLTALEIEMQTSPNDEILRSIGLSPQQEEESSSPVEPIYFHQSPDLPMSSRRLSRKERRNSSTSVIGVWRDGSVAWDTKRRAESNAPGSQSIDEIMDLTSLTGPAEVDSRSSKPKIQVVIPQSRSRRLSNPTYLPPIPPSEELTLKELVIDGESIHLQVPSGHNRTNSSESFSQESVSSEEDRASSPGMFSNRSSMTSINSESLSGAQEDQGKRKEDPNQSPKSDSSVMLESVDDPAEVKNDSNDKNQQVPSLLDLVDIVRTPSTRVPHRVNRSYSGSIHPMSTLRENEEETFEPEVPSPTLSEAERSLETHLSTLSQVQEWRAGSLQRTFTIPRKPAPPPKSVKRLSRNVSLPASSAPRTRERSSSMPQTPPPPPSPTRNAPAPPAMLSPALPSRPAPPPPLPEPVLKRSSSVRSCLSLILEEKDRDIAADDAEKVIYHILSNMADVDDLFSMARMNKAFYRVFKLNELELMQDVLKNMSPAAWEFKQTCLIYDDEDPDSAIPAPEYTAAGYCSSYMRDCQVLANVKAMILQRCQSIIRSTTEDQLLHHDPLRKSSIDDALWRIWTFTKIFGCGKGREDDVATQLDWLRGGVLSHQTTAQCSFSATASWVGASELLGTSEHFAMGNSDVSAEELYDMLELWNCLRSISGGIVGKTEYARQYGVYDDTDILGGDIDGEDLMLEEWHSYLLTLGLSVIFQISEAETSQTAFKIAKINQWTRWAAPALGKSTRSNFLRESVSRLYEELINEVFSPSQSHHQEMREIRRRRTSSLAVELKHRKADPSNEFPLHTVEVPISRANTVLEHLSTPRRENFGTSSFPRHASHTLSMRSAPPGFVSDSPISSPLDAHSPQVTNHFPHSPPSPPSPPSGQSGPPIMQHPFQVMMNATDPSVNSSDKAIFRLMEMGFTSDEAKGALKITDMGDGLRIDRAVEYLLRQQCA